MDLTYKNWLKELIKIIADYYKIHQKEVKLNNNECISCFESGMCPYQAFLESHH